MTAITKAGYQPGVDVGIAMDVAASEFYSAERSVYKVDGKELSSSELVSWYVDLVGRYPICSIEDGMAEDDWSGWKQLTLALGRKIQLVGDDLFVTNPTRLQRGLDDGIANSILIKVNQIGTLSETIDASRSERIAKYYQLLRIHEQLGPAARYAGRSAFPTLR